MLESLLYTFIGSLGFWGMTNPHHGVYRAATTAISLTILSVILGVLILIFGIKPTPESWQLIAYWISNWIFWTTAALAGRSQRMVLRTYYNVPL